jgi:hypothetical protein
MRPVGESCFFEFIVHAVRSENCASERQGNAMTAGKKSILRKLFEHSGRPRYEIQAVLMRLNAIHADAHAMALTLP